MHRHICGSLAPNSHGPRRSKALDRHAIDPNQIRAMDWMHDELFEGHRLWVLTAVDSWSGACSVMRMCRSPRRWIAPTLRDPRYSRVSVRTQRDAVLKLEIHRVLRKNLRVDGVRKIWRRPGPEGEDLACSVNQARHSATLALHAQISQPIRFGEEHACKLAEFAASQYPPPGTPLL